ncbi:hypothetical protein ACER0A_000895 [Haloimpatiens sp. FM7315]|uniref:hypothetical protein n=1 Tax=Haloimpatiens sp. FM7315 TaxID=3298609 RepID=UPI0035A39433
MGTLIGLEFKKMFFKKRLFILWALTIFLCLKILRHFNILETYASIFHKSYEIVPLMGILMFMGIASSYTLEYSSNMVQLIKTTRNGKGKIVLAKSIAAGIGSSIINLSIFLAVVLSGLNKYKFKSLDLPIKNLWYFGNSGSNLTVIQMILIMVVTIILGSFVFSQIGLLLSSISKSAVIPFVFGGLTMGVPYFISEFLHNNAFLEYLGLTPLWGMMSCQLVRYKVPMMSIGFLIVLFLGVMVVVPKLTLGAFKRQ